MSLKKPKIVFLDASTVDLGDIRMSPIKKEGVYRSVAHCPGGKIPRSLRDAEIVISNKVVFGEKEFAAFPNLKMVCVAATGVNNIDLEAAKRHRVGVCNVSGYSTTTVVEHTIQFLLSFSHRLLEHDHSVKSGNWSRSPIFTLLYFPFNDLEGKNLGILGYGTIGKRVGKIATALGMKVLVGKVPGRKYHNSKNRVGLKTLLKNSDFVTLHSPLTPQTKGLIDFEKLSWMKPTAYLLNMARGPIVVEKDVARALKKKIIAGYGADVTCVEPLPKGHPFLQKSLSKKILLSPHVAWASRESRQRLVDEIGGNIAAFKRGKKRNRLV